LLSGGQSPAAGRPRISACIAGILLGVLLPAAGLSDSLHDAVRAAVTTNPTGRAANADVQATAFELLQLRGEYLPTIELFGEFGGDFVNTSNLTLLTARNNNQMRLGGSVGVAANFTLFDGFRRANQVYRNAAALDGSIFRLLDASETMALNATEAYIDTLRHRHLIQVMTENVERHREIRSRVRDLVDTGALPSSDLFEAEEQTLAAQIALLDVERALADAGARYEAVIGKPPGARMSLPQVGGLPGSLQNLTITAVKNSYKVRYADTLVRQAGYEKGVQEADLLPTVDFRAGINQNVNRRLTTGGETDAFVGLRMSWEFSTGGRRATRNALTSRVREAMAERDLAVRDVQELAARAWNAYHTAQKRVQLTDRQLRSTRQILDQYETQFEAGTRSLLDLLSAERAFYNTRFQDVSSEAALAFARFRLLAAQSRLSDYFGVDPADIPLDPRFHDQVIGRPTQIFNTDIPALE
jgi:adhesin transport system outer membrane protein